MACVLQPAMHVPCASLRYAVFLRKKGSKAYLRLVRLDGRDASPNGVPGVLYRPACAKLALRDAHDARHWLRGLDCCLVDGWDLPRPSLGVLCRDIHL